MELLKGSPVAPAMKYMFTTQYGGVTDAIVLDLDDEHDAWRQAVSAAGEALSDIDGHLGLPDSFTVNVSNEAGHALFELMVMTRRLRAN
jgi:hypothetical protein